MTLFELAHRYVGEVKERPDGDHPLIQWWLSLCGFGFDVKDEIPWCSAFVNGIAWELRLPRTKSAAARSWLKCGETIFLDQASADDCIVVLSRGSNPVQGHVGIFAGQTGPDVSILGGNQGNGISIEHVPINHVLGVRRLRA